MIGEYKVCFLQETHLSQWKCGLTGGGGFVWGRGRKICGGGETGHQGWHHLIVWDNKHMVIGSECRPAIIVSQKILQFHSSQYL